MRARSTTDDSVGLVVVTKGVTSPATVTWVAVPATLMATSMAARWPVCSTSCPVHLSMPVASTVNS